MRFRTILTITVAALITAVVAATVGAVFMVLERTAREELARDLARSAAAFTELEGFSESLHRAQGQVMAGEPRLKAVTSAEDVTSNTVFDVAVELRKGIRSDLFLFTDARGLLLADASDANAHGVVMIDQPLVAKALEAGASSGIWQRASRVYQIQGRRISLGQEALGVLVIGYEIDDRFASAIERQTGSAVVLELADRIIARSPFSAHLGVSDSALALALSRVPTGASTPTELMIGGSRLLATAHVAPAVTDGTPLRFVVVRSLDQALASARSVQKVLLLIAAIALAFASLVVLAISRALSRPVDRLLAFIRRVGAGALDERIRAEGPLEMRALGGALNAMVCELAESREQVAKKEQLEKELEIGARIQTGLRDANEGLRKARDEAEAAKRGTQLILDNMGQGFLMVDVDGVVAEGRSAVVEAWLGPFPRGARIWEYIGTVDREVGMSLELGWSALKDDVLPVELVIYQMPQRLALGERHYQFSYCPILEGAQVTNMVIVISDSTVIVERERVEAAHSELVSVLHHAMKDRPGFFEFVDEANEMVQIVSSGEYANRSELMRIVHTLKGNCGLVGIASFAKYCHELETRMLESERPLAVSEREQFRCAWAGVSARLAMFTGSSGAEKIEIAAAEYRALKEALAEAVPHAELLKMTEEWRYQPTSLRLERIAGQASALATRLDKGELKIVIEDNTVRIAPAKWSRFWGAFVHVVRNAVDHGIESAEERVARGKPEAGLLLLRTALVDEEVLVEIRDDGRGIDWAAIADKARHLGLPSITHDDLVEALFADGLSTRDEATEVSGRGVGMGAVRAVCRELGGVVRVESTLHAGTLIQFRIPRVNAVLSASVPPRPAPASSRDCH